MNYFVTAIHTDSGKTLVSAILTQMLGVAYWKPVQSGSPRDTDTVKSLVTNPAVSFLEEAFLLKTPASPHAAARIDQVDVRLEAIKMPSIQKGLVMEGAGGLMVPLNEDEMMVDLIQSSRAETVVVSNFYLGSINHTLLSYELLKSRNIPVKGVIFNGDDNPESRDIILNKTGWKHLLSIPQESEITSDTVLKYATILKQTWD